MDAALQSRELWMTVLESTLACAIAVPALIGNILLCLAIYRFRALRKIQYYYIFTLAVSDFLLTLLFISLSFAVPILGRWPFGEAVCQMQVSLIYYFASFSLLNMMLMALNRYHKIVRSVNIFQRIYTKNHVLISIVASAFFSRVFVIPFVTQMFCFHSGKLACIVCKSGDRNEQPFILVSYAVLIAMTYPVIAICYWKVFRQARAYFAQVAESTLHEDAQKSFAEEVKVTKVLFAILIAFVICWKPAFAIEFLDTLEVYLLVP